MSILDLNSKDEIVVPAKPAVGYPLNYATKILMEGDTSVMRAYVELTPYRRVYQNMPYPAVNPDGSPRIMAGSQVPMMSMPEPVMDTDGNPVLDANGNPSMTEPAPLLDADGNPVLSPGTQEIEYRLTLVGEELMPPTAEGFAKKVLNVPNILPANPTPQGMALVAGFLTQYLQAGGDLSALVMGGMVILIDQIGIQQGVLSPES